MRSILRSGIGMCNDGDETIRKSCNNASVHIHSHPCAPRQSLPAPPHVTHLLCPDITDNGGHSTATSHPPKWALPTLCASNSHFGHKTLLHTLAPAPPTRFILETHPIWFSISWPIQMHLDHAPGHFNLSTALHWVAHAFHYLYLTDFSLISIFCILNYSTIVPVLSNNIPSSIHVTS